MGKSKTDCREYDGITVGLIDSIITASRVLRSRLYEYHKAYERRYQKDIEPNILIPESVYEALKDLHQDEDLLFILQAGPYNKRIMSNEDRLIMNAISNAATLLKDNKIPIEI